ncbi:MAG TPA: helix-turn-helix domain-containing protein [Eggerthellaceae bacterium]|nr:helix-turn-helix domain-containing protein [Eggerthellaceae bacterium]
MHHISFGNVLKEARLARGLDLTAVSRELRIRQDIIVAIENSDFARMPSRGYARNMIIAYARLVGLNPQDVSRMYLDQEYAYQVEQAHRSVGDTIQMHNEPYRRGSENSGNGQTGRIPRSEYRSKNSNSSSRNGLGYSSQANRNLYDGSSNGFGRRMYSQNADEPPYAPRNNAPVAHRARRSAMADGRYTNLYTAPKNIPNPNRKRNIIIGVIIAVVLVIILIVALFLTHRNEPQTNIPVTGVDVTAQQQTEDTTQTQEPVETPPTEFTLRYEVADGSETYIEVYVDDNIEESSTVTGPAQQTYTSSSKIRFVATETDGVTLYINDEAVELTTNDSGIVNTTYTFEDILNQWYEDHPNVTRTNTQSNTSTNASSSSGTSTNSSSTGASNNSSSSSNNEE